MPRGQVVAPTDGRAESFDFDSNYYIATSYQNRPRDRPSRCFTFSEFPLRVVSFESLARISGLRPKLPFSNRARKPSLNFNLKIV
jgi:hypothetical protein